MRFLMKVIAGLLVVVLLIWAGAEAAMLLAARRAADGGRLGVGESAMLIDPARIGITMGEVSWLRMAGDVLEMDALSIWLPPWAPNAIHADLPEHTRQTGAAGHRDITIAAGQAHARFSPFRRLAMTDAGLTLDSLAIDDEALLGPVALDLQLTNYGAEVPPEIRAAYRLDVRADGIALPAMTRRWEIGEASGETPGIARVTGPMVIWLSHAINPRQTDAPRIEAVAFDGLLVEIDGHQATIRGRLGRDETGQIRGELALDMPDLRGFVLAAGHAGLFPVGYGHLTATALETVADEAAEAMQDEAAPINSTNLQALRHQPRSSRIPPRPPGMRRLPIRLEPGQVHLGNLPLSALLAGRNDAARDGGTQNP